MGVLRVLEGCRRVFEVCLKGVWKLFHKKSFFFTNEGFPNTYNIIYKA